MANLSERNCKLWGAYFEKTYIFQRKFGVVLAKCDIPSRQFRPNGEAAPGELAKS